MLEMESKQLTETLTKKLFKNSPNEIINTSIIEKNEDIFLITAECRGIFIQKNISGRLSSLEKKMFHVFEAFSEVNGPECPGDTLIIDKKVNSCSLTLTDIFHEKIESNLFKVVVPFTANLSFELNMKSFSTDNNLIAFREIEQKINELKEIANNLLN